MRCGIARDDAGMERGAGPRNPVHPGHRGRAIHIRMMPPLLLQDAEGADKGGMLGGSGRDRRRRDQSRAAIDVDLLLTDRDDDNHRLVLVERHNRLGRGRRFGLLPGFSRVSRNHQGESRDSQPRCRSPRRSCGDLDRLYATHTPRFQRTRPRP